MSKIEDDIAFLYKTLLDAHAYHVKHGVKGCDPRLFWYFPAYRHSLIRRNWFNVLLRKVESLLIRIIPTILRYYQRLCKIPDVVSPYGLALFVQAYCRLYKITREEEFLTIALSRADMLIKSLIPTGSGNLGVSNPLEPDTETNLPAGSEAVFALIDLYEIVSDDRYLKLAEKITDSFDHDFQKKRIANNTVCLDYTVGSDGRYVLNANALAAGAMARVAEQLNNKKYDYLIECIVNYIKPYLYDDNDLPYAGIEDGISSKIYDVYHTGFTLRGLSCAVVRIDEDVKKIKEAVKQKVQKLRYDFLNKKGLVRVSRRGPTIDVHGVAEYIRCLSDLDFSESDLEIFERNVKYMIKDGSFYYQRGIRDIFIYMPRWGHAPMMLSISEVLIKSTVLQH